MTSSPPRFGHGMLLGKFMPPHAGHQLLVEFALGYADSLTILVCTMPGEPIPGAKRAEWMRQLFGSRARVVHVDRTMPQQPGEHPEFWRLWRELVLEHVSAPIDLVFASEDYGAPLAAQFDARFVPVDVSRTQVPVSGTAIRADPMSHWGFIPEPVRPYFARRVCVFGPESTGKSTLTRRLATHYSTLAVDEYARVVLDHAEAPLGVADFDRIARGQLAAEDALARRCDRLLFCDTDTLTTTLWADALLGEVPEWIDTLASSRRYDLTLLCDVDVPWVDDDQRYFPDPGERAAFLARCVGALEAAGRDYVVVRGDWEARWLTAVDAVDALLAS